MKQVIRAVHLIQNCQYTAGVKKLGVVDASQTGGCIEESETVRTIPLGVKRIEV